MQVTAQTCKTFYQSKTGRVVRRILRRRIAELWPDMQGLDCAGFGYAPPYLGAFEETAGRCIAFMNADNGGHHWPSPEGALNKTAVIDPQMVPVGAERFDRIIMVHHLEYIQKLKDNLEEAWHILRPHGRMIIIVPNRHGLWAHADWSPFGNGMPFSLSQILYYLKGCGFTLETTQEALFMPPSRRGLPVRFAGLFEQTLRYCLPIVSGVHVIEVSKQIYRPTGKGIKASKLRTSGLFPAGAS